MKITYDQIRASDAVKTYILAGNDALGTIGFTEHGLAHATKAAVTAADILAKLGYDVPAEKLVGLMPMYVERAADLNSLAEFLTIYFKPAVEIEIEEKAMKALNEDGKYQLSVLHGLIAEMPEFTAEALDTLLHDYVAKGGLKFKQVGPPLRSALTGLAGGPSVHDVMAALGREESLARIKRAAE